MCHKSKPETKPSGSITTNVVSAKAKVSQKSQAVPTLVIDRKSNPISQLHGKAFKQSGHFDVQFLY